MQCSTQIIPFFLSYGDVCVFITIHFHRRAVDGMKWGCKSWKKTQESGLEKDNNDSSERANKKSPGL